MAIVSWNGNAGDGTVTTAGNYVGGAAPNAGGGDSVIAVLAPSSPMTNGTFPALVDFTVSDAYGVNPIGALGAPITFGNVTGTMTIGSRSPFVTVTTTGTVASAKFQCPLNNQIYIAGGTWTLVTASQLFTLNVAASAVVVTGLNPGGATWICATNGTGFTTWSGAGRINTTTRNIATVNLDPGGVLTLLGSSVYTTGNIVAAQVNHQSSAAPTTTNLRSNSVFTVIGNPNNTTTGGTINIWTGSRVVDVVPGCTMTYTASVIGIASSPIPGGS